MPSCQGTLSEICSPPCCDSWEEHLGPSDRRLLLVRDTPERLSHFGRVFVDELSVARRKELEPWVPVLALPLSSCEDLGKSPLTLTSLILYHTIFILIDPKSFQRGIKGPTQGSGSRIALVFSTEQQKVNICAFKSPPENCLQPIILNPVKLSIICKYKIISIFAKT